MENTNQTMRSAALVAAMIGLSACAMGQEPNRDVRGEPVADEDDDVDVTHALAGCAEVERIAGVNRFDTAVKLAKVFRPDARRFLLVGGAGASIDAVAAGPLAARMEAAILPSELDTLSPEVREALLGAEEVVLLGGENVLSLRLEEEVKGLGVPVQRIAGPDRFSTAAAIAQRFGNASRAVIASGENAARVDALLGGSLGAALGVPVLLTQRGALPGVTRDMLIQLGVTETIVIGGSDVVADAVLERLPSPRRVSGPDRFETAAAVASDLGLDSSTVLVVEATPSPDAVVATAFGLPLAYSHTNELPAASEAIVASAQRVVLVGGTAVLDANVEAQSCELVAPQAPPLPPPPVTSEAVDFFTVGGERPERDGWEYGPSIVLHDGTYHAWYCGRGPGGMEDGIASNWDVILHMSSSDGRNWTAPRTVLGPDGDYFDTSVCDPSVIQKDGRWLMYVTCIDEGAPDGYKGNRICAATADSPDAASWTRHPEPLYTDFDCAGAAGIDLYCVGQPSALVVDDEVRLYVTNRDTGHPSPSPGDLELLTSRNGIDFGAPQVVFDHANVDVKFDRASGYSFMVYGEVDDANIYWNLSADGRTWMPHDDGRTIAVNPDDNNNNPGLAGDARGTFSGQTWAAYGSTVPGLGDVPPAVAWGRWNLFRSDVFVGIQGGDEDCRACVTDSCDLACQRGGRDGGTCGVGGSSEASACCSCD